MVKAVDEPLDQLAARLSREHGVRIEVDEKALHANYIDPRQKVSLHVRDVPLLSALHLLTRRLRVSPPPEPNRPGIPVRFG